MAPLHWGAEDLWLQLEPLLPGLSIEVLAKAGSTNSLLLDRARVAPGDTPPCLLVAEEQTGGRGRLGRAWHSRAGASLTFSLALPLAPADWSGLSLAVGLALAEALDPAAPGAAPRIGLKWPNDLWLLDGPTGSGLGRKLGGILIETIGAGSQRLAVVGVGLNLQPLPLPKPLQQPLDGLSQGYACLQELTDHTAAPQVLACVALPLLAALLRFQTAGYAPLAAAYARRDVLRGCLVSTTLADLPHGRAEGVDGQGALLVRHGALHRVVSGDVSVRLQPQPQPPALPLDSRAAAATAPQPGAR